MGKQPEYRINLRWYRPLYFPVLLPVAFLLALFNRLSPIPLKIHCIRVERIGQMAGNQEEVLCQIHHGLLPREYRVYVHRDKPCNQVMMNMIRRAMPVRNWLLPLFDVCHKLGGLGVSSTEFMPISGQDWDQLVHRTPQHFFFSREEEAEARRQLRKLGVAEDEEFVPVLGRDSAYLQQLKEPTDDDSYRNVDINTFIPAMELVADHYKVIRVGSVVMDALQTSHPNILDYSLSGKRTELLDIYLSAKCRFFFTCGTGLDAIASCNFRLPVLYVNYTPIFDVPPTKKDGLMILKKYWHTADKRYLTLSELIDTDIYRMCTPRELNPLGIVMHDNTPEEILDVTREMLARLDGTWIETDEDRANQKRFWSQFSKVTDCPPMGRIGARFLRDNPYWME